MASRRLGPFGQGCCLAFGACAGTLAFFLLVSFVLGKPFQDAVLSAHGVLVAHKRTSLSQPESALVLGMLQKGSLISSNDLLSNMTSFYSTMIQTLIATFFVFGLVSFFVVQAHSRRHVEEVAEELVEAATKHHFGSASFERHIRESVDSAVSIELESLDERLRPLEQMSENVQELDQRVSELHAGTKPQDNGVE
jgi:hypothetical protein